MAEPAADDQLWSRVVTLSGRVESELAKAMQRKHRLGLSEYRALCHLAGADQGELRMQELADAVGLNQSSASRLVARLESAGLTVRDHCPADRRGVYSVITEAGRELHAAAQPTYLAALAAALDRAAADPDLATTVKALRG
ncbi:MarR family transcriptional regulator [Saccharopolyspora sp. NPDC050642]|uniref:MarR family winged helix-turn-helix transcriptional regulator n=1 Tax=Saccharopolyspora sp. NPDC050642 TaxID=3157099 RepID=UPI0033E655B5